MIVRTIQTSKIAKVVFVACATNSNFAHVIASSKHAKIRARLHQYNYSVPLSHSRHRYSSTVTDNKFNNLRRHSNMKDSYSDPVPDRASVDDATILWIETVTSGVLDAPQRVTRLYAQDAILWGTVSDQVRTTPDQILDYFEHFARVPGIRLIPESLRSCVQIYGNIALSSGYYSFSCSPKNTNGPPRIIHGRYSFVYRRLSSPHKEGVMWEIVNHHSSIIPNPPPDLSNINECSAGSILTIA